MHSAQGTSRSGCSFASRSTLGGEAIPVWSLTLWNHDQALALPEKPYGSIGNCYGSLTDTPDLQGTEDNDMKITMSTILVFMISTAQAFAGTPQQIGAWSVIPATDNHSNAVLIQTASDSAGAKLDLICRKGKIWKVVVETSIPLQEDAVSFNRGIPTTRVNYVSDDATGQFEDWAVADGGKTLSAHSQIFEGRLQRQWIERLSTSKTMRFNFDAQDFTFQTGKLAQALDSAACTY